MHSQFSFDEMKSRYAVARSWLCQILARKSKSDGELQILKKLRRVLPNTQA
jgi:hypothetical protein